MDDETIKKNVTDELYWDAQVDASEIKTTVTDGIVKLEGKVPTYGTKIAARTDAWNIPGVRSVINDLTVMYKTEIPTDMDIRNIVKEKLLWNPYVNSQKIDVEVRKGIVTLSGSVDAYWKKVNAETETHMVLGVISVVNKIGVVPTGDFVDEDIARDITESFFRNINVPDEKVNVNVENGKVRLTGAVPHLNSYVTAERIAERTLGVIEVENDIRVE